MSAMKPGDLMWKTLEPIEEALDKAGNVATVRKKFKPALLNLLAADRCQAEVLNGGFEQYFQNPDGELAPEAVKGFRAVGLPDAARLLQKAMRCLGKPFPRDCDDRGEKMYELSDKSRKLFEQLFNEFTGITNWKTNRFELAADKYVVASGLYPRQSKEK
ncbi:MAG TPA: DUF4375 domain-containing protein [Planctomycetota bacterium]|nr:DUF4375 domain-containing protein [Planctomycetota bacterium]